MASGDLRGTVVAGYVMNDVLGRGAFGTVYRATSLTSSEVVAVKVMSRAALQKKRDFVRVGGRMQISTALDKVRRELAIMRKVSHRNVVRCIDILEDDADLIYLILEYVEGGEAMSWVEDKAPPPPADVVAGSDGGGATAAASGEADDGADDGAESPVPREIGHYEAKLLLATGTALDAGAHTATTAAAGASHPHCFSVGQTTTLLRDVLTGLAYLHDLAIAHRDIKPENILISTKDQQQGEETGRQQTADGSSNSSGSGAPPHPPRRLRALLADLGVAHMYPPDATDDTLAKTEGTPAFHAPESTVPGAQFSGKASDVWATGCCGYAFLCGALPFTPRAGETQPMLYERIRGSCGGDATGAAGAAGDATTSPGDGIDWGRLRRDSDELRDVAPAAAAIGAVPGAPSTSAAATALPRVLAAACMLDLLSLLLSRDPARRPTAAEALEHPCVRLAGAESPFAAGDCGAPAATLNAILARWLPFLRGEEAGPVVVASGSDGHAAPAFIADDHPLLVGASAAAPQTAHSAAHATPPHARVVTSWTDDDPALALASSTGKSSRGSARYTMTAEAEEAAVASAAVHPAAAASGAAAGGTVSVDGAGVGRRRRSLKQLAAPTGGGALSGDVDAGAAAASVSDLMSSAPAATGNTAPPSACASAVASPVGGRRGAGVGNEGFSTGNSRAGSSSTSSLLSSSSSSSVSGAASAPRSHLGHPLVITPADLASAVTRLVTVGAPHATGGGAAGAAAATVVGDDAEAEAGAALSGSLASDGPGGGGGKVALAIPLVRLRARIHKLVMAFKLRSTVKKAHAAHKRASMTAAAAMTAASASVSGGATATTAASLRADLQATPPPPPPSSSSQSTAAAADGQAATSPVPVPTSPAPVARSPVARSPHRPFTPADVPVVTSPLFALGAEVIAASTAVSRAADTLAAHAAAAAAARSPAAGAGAAAVTPARSTRRSPAAAPAAAGGSPVSLSVTTYHGRAPGSVGMPVPTLASPPPPMTAATPGASAHGLFASLPAPPTLPTTSSSSSSRFSDLRASLRQMEASVGGVRTGTNHRNAAIVATQHAGSPPPPLLVKHVTISAAPPVVAAPASPPPMPHHHQRTFASPVLRSADRAAAAAAAARTPTQAVPGTAAAAGTTPPSAAAAVAASASSGSINTSGVVSNLDLALAPLSPPSATAGAAPAAAAAATVTAATASADAPGSPAATTAVAGSVGASAVEQPSGDGAAADAPVSVASPAAASPSGKPPTSPQPVLPALDFTAYSPAPPPPTTTTTTTTDVAAASAATGKVIDATASGAGSYRRAAAAAFGSGGGVYARVRAALFNGRQPGGATGAAYSSSSSASPRHLQLAFGTAVHAPARW